MQPLIATLPLDVICELIKSRLKARGVGLFRTSNHVLRQVDEVLYDLTVEATATEGVVMRPAPPTPPTLYPEVPGQCPVCLEPRSVIHQYADGTMHCTECKDRVNEQ